MDAHCPRCGFFFQGVDWGGYSLDFRNQCFSEYPKVRFTGGQFRLLVLLMEAKGEFVARDKCVKVVSHYHGLYQPEQRIVDVAVSRIRAKLKPWGCQPIETKRSNGYRMIARVDVEMKL